MKDAIKDRYVGGGKIEMLIESRDKVKKLLKELFQFNNQDLDCGIYRIMNFKRKEIEQFIEKDLLKAAEAEFKEYAKVGMADLQKEIRNLRIEINRDFGEGTIDEQGHVIRHREAPKLKEYTHKMKELERVEITQAQMEEVFNHIYEFFSRYYDKGDFISKRRYGGRDKYYIPYDGEEVHLHWATADQYYVKTGEYFKKYSFTAGRYHVNFVLKKAETAPNNVKVGKRYFLLHDEEVLTFNDSGKELDIHLKYRELRDAEKRMYGTRNIQDKITSQIINQVLSKVGDQKVGVLLQKKDGGDKTILEKHLWRYITRNTADYFIHKKLKSFLERELEFFLKNEVWDLDELEHMDERNIRINKAKVRAIKEISNKIIEFLAQIEDFQKMLFEKKKFIFRTDYCLTLNLISEHFYEEIGKNELQVAEWKNLYKLDEVTKSTLESTIGKKTLDVDFLKSHRYLVIDTRFFTQDFKDRLLTLFDNLDEAINGVIIKSENLQALSLLLEKYREHVKCIYIDPPYNTGSDNFLFKDNYQHSSWLTMMYDRLDKGIELLNVKGNLLVNIGDEENGKLKLLMMELLKPINFITNLIWRKRKGGGNDSTFVAVDHDYILLFVKEKSVHNLKWRVPYDDAYLKRYNQTDEEGKYYWDTLSRPGLNKPIIYDVKCPDGTWIRNGEWQISEETFHELKKQGDIRIIKTKDRRWTVHHKVRQPSGRVFRSIILDVSNTDAAKEMQNIFGDKKAFSHPKPVGLINSILRLNNVTDGFILDFFAGSGTTAHAVIELNRVDNANRKYILVEMADYFESILKPRIQKVIYSQEWDMGLPQSTKGISHMFKYMYLEQYEDALNNIVFRSFDKTVQETLDGYQDYFIRYMLDYETQDSPTRIMMDTFQTPFDYKIKVNRTGEKDEFTPVDLVETFNYLLGLNVEKLRFFKAGELIYRAVFGKKKEETIVVIWRNTKDLDLVEDKQFIEETILSEHSPDQIFINGDSYVKNAKAIEPEFKRLMGA